MKKKGFTLIELLAVIVILAIVGLVTVPIVSNVIDRSETRELNIQANFMLEAGQNFFVDYFDTYVPETEGEKSKVLLQTLIDEGYIDEIKVPNSSDKYCDPLNSFVYIGRASNRKYIYAYTLKCEDKTVTDSSLNTIMDTYSLSASSPD